MKNDPSIFADEQRLKAIAAITERYHEDAEFRSQLENLEGDEVARLFEQFSFQPIEGVKYRFLADTDDVVHCVMPPDPNVELSDEQLSQLSAGSSTASTAGTAGSASTVICFTSISSIGTASSVGSAGTAGG